MHEPGLDQCNVPAENDLYNPFKKVEIIITTIHSFIHTGGTPFRSPIFISLAGKKHKVSVIQHFLLYWPTLLLSRPNARIKGHLEPTHLKYSPLFTFSTKS